MVGSQSLNNSQVFQKAGFSPSNDLKANKEADITLKLNTLSLTIVSINFEDLSNINGDINICNTEEVDRSKSAMDLLMNSSFKLPRMLKTARKQTKQNWKSSTSKSPCKKPSLVLSNFL
ncbi:hypothetical protein ElyMa_000836200 [Elysia marginata]|uniref:Uncharacterized protein n=1 Tax=Elysia marginata TaxID=1093978 RepID=A0AAV4H178_9GAST|nr:hypothetical protein ElyMa_000836200 [Elysia marginata]